MKGDDELYTFPRARIITLLDKHPEGLTKEKISELTKVNRSSVLHHLKILEKRKLIKISKPNKKKRGAPTFVYLTPKATPLSEKSIEMFHKLASLFKE